MIASARSWFRRNRTTFAVGAGVLGAGYVATQFVLGKITETRQRMSDDRIAKENLRRRFEQNQEDCTFTVLAILPAATENILEALPVEQTLSELQRQREERVAKSSALSEVSTADLASIPGSIGEEDGKSLRSFQSESYVHASQLADSTAADGDQKFKPAGPLRTKKSKAILWNEMKIGCKYLNTRKQSTIARAFVLIYTLALLTLLTRIQLNLLGRRNYLASVVSLAAPQTKGPGIRLENRDDDSFETAYGNDFDTNRKYLSLSWWLLHRGSKEIMDMVNRAVKEVFGLINPREELTLERLSELIVEVRKKVEGATPEERKQKRWLPFLLPAKEDEDFVLQASGMTSPEEAPSNNSPSLRRLVDETSDIIDSPIFSEVLTLILDAAFSLLVDTKIASLAYKIPLTSASPTRIHEIVGTDHKARLANTLAIFCRQAHAIGATNDNEYLTAMEGVRDLEAFSAVVYSSNFEIESPEFLGVSSAPSAADPSSSRLGTSTLPTPAGPGFGQAVDQAGDPLPPGLEGEPSLIEGSDLEKAWASAVAQDRQNQEASQ
ncbi:Peroxin-3 [Microthyrium microscopicum]|uniref:Peroxin-3 n=1 Tax=Microthyrium microscopicum TaxID=703497 RepID=A0A6A6U4I6_9PEZI|nr:Peroxin-3 [Microthyrium microscopicum]